MSSLLTPMLLLVLACGDKDAGDTGNTGSDAGTADGGSSDGGSADGGGTDDAYAFESAFGGGSSVAYSGQVFRQLLIDDMKTHLGGVTDRIDSGSFFPADGDVEGELLFYFEFDSDSSGMVELLVNGDVPLLQSTYDDVSSDKDLEAKLAGNDATGQHADWSTDFVGWPQDGVTTPESLVRSWIDTVDSQAVAWGSGQIPLDPSGAPVPAVYVTAQGQDMQQLLEKFLRVAVAFSQGTDDYLDDDLEGKGLNADNSAAEEGEPYTALEHAWDEGFGYFGAARSYPDWTDQEISDTPLRDVDGDGVIDLTREVCWGHSTNAAKRDLGSAADAATDFTAVAWAGFADGRQLISDNAGNALSADDFALLQGHRDQAVSAWEQSLAATVVHYINQVLVDTAAIGTDDYSFENHAKHWSELKGFALGLQFNPRSPLTEAEFAAMHDYLGTAPVLADASASDRDNYAQDLRDARSLLGDAYGFDTANLGDDDGNGGW